MRDNNLDKVENDTCSAALLEEPQNVAIAPLCNPNTTLVAEGSHNIEDNFLKTDTNEKYNQTPLLWPQILAATTVAFIHLGLGVFNGFTGIILPSLTNPNSTDIYLNTHEVVIFTSSAGMGLTIGSIPAGFLANWLGQRMTMVFFIPLGICGWIILAVVKSVFWLTVSRVLIGIMGGICLSVCITYVIEVSHTDIRGRLLAMIDLFRQFGLTLVAVVGSTNLHWRTVGLACGLSTLIPPLIVFLFLPNSPRWLATQGRKNEATSALRYFRGNSYNVEEEVDSIFLQLTNSKENRKTFHQMKLLFKGKMFRRFAILAVLILITNFVGNIAMITYNITVFQAADTGIDEYMCTIIASVMRFIGTGTYIILAQKCYRRTVLITSYTSACVCLITFGAYFYRLENNYDMQYIKWVPLTVMMVFVFSTGVSGPVVMLLTGELLPTSVRAAGNGILFWIFSVTLFILVFTFPYMFEYMGPHWTFWIYACNALFVVILSIFYIPETKGKTLEEIGDMQL